VTAINDPFMDAKLFCYLLKYDSTHGTLNLDIAPQDDNTIKVGDIMTIKLLTIRDPKEIPWKQYGVDIVIESTGVFTKIANASQHIHANGAKKVLISAPSEDAPMFVYGVNHEKYDPATMHVVSNASCTTNCLAPVAKVIHEKFGIKQGLMSTIHAVTATQKTVDGPSSKAYRDGRSAHSNIIPASTGAAKAVGKVIPELNGKLTGMAFRVPVTNVSVVDVTFTTEKKTDLKSILAALQEASSGDLKGVLDCTSESVVSTDLNGNKNSSIVDVASCMTIEGSDFFKVVSWYDNETGYSCRMVDMVKVLSKSL